MGYALSRRSPWPTSSLASTCTLRSWKRSLPSLGGCEAAFSSATTALRWRLELRSASSSSTVSTNWLRSASCARCRFKLRRPTAARASAATRKSLFLSLRVFLGPRDACGPSAPSSSSSPWSKGISLSSTSISVCNCVSSSTSWTKPCRNRPGTASGRSSFRSIFFVSAATSTASASWCESKSGLYEQPGKSTSTARMRGAGTAR
mmetsp:Transcript_10148/g.17671  ORF Transcript_10148/g.17671 Transcript_10148/m.17671 type:complete len:205 (+) Transcript_10148:552-1166(+)